MKLILLGTTGYHPNDRRQTACMMLPELGVVLDAGTAMYRVREHLATPELDIFLTHAHLDHVIGVTYLFDIIHEKNVDRVTVHATADKLAAIETHLLAKSLFPATPPCEFRPLAASVALRDGYRLTHFPLTHPGGAVGYRIDGAKASLAYVTDTTASTTEAYVEQIRGVDLLIHECYFPDAMQDLARKTGHSWTTAVAEVARAAGVGRVVLVHINPLFESDDVLEVERARKIFPRTEIGCDEMQIEL